MITAELAEALRRAGLSWSPAPGDRFRVPGRQLGREVFVLSDMVIEPRRTAGGAEVLAFNGTTEWALDTLHADEALWLPREEQLRERLGPAFRALEAVPDPTGEPGPGGTDDAGPAWAVVVEVGGRTERVVDVDAECALARALLAVLGRVA